MRAQIAVLTGVLLIGSTVAAGVELPALCASATAPADSTTPIPELRKQVEEKSETDPDASVAILCMAIPRVAREYGEDSPELAWWVGSLTMPMIAYRNQFAEAIPLLKFAQPILEKRYGVLSAEVADIHVAYAWIYQRQGRYADSAQAWERALRIRERFPGARKIELQKALVGLALVKLFQGDFPPARAALQKAHDILTENNDLVSEAAAAVENVFTNLAFREEKFAEAKQHAERQIAIEKQLQAGIGQFVPAYVFLAQILEHLDDFDGSEAASREAIRLSESANGPLQRHHFTALTQLGSLQCAWQAGGSAARRAASRRGRRADTRPRRAEPAEITPEPRRHPPGTRTTARGLASLRTNGIHRRKESRGYRAADTRFILPWIGGARVGSRQYRRCHHRPRLRTGCRQRRAVTGASKGLSDGDARAGID